MICIYATNVNLPLQRVHGWARVLQFNGIIDSLCARERERVLCATLLFRNAFKLIFHENVLLNSHSTFAPVVHTTAQWKSLVVPSDTMLCPLDA